jgi:serine/threonine protein kinase
VALLDALSDAHRDGVVHRDVKPSNVLLPDDGSVRLADFGIASIKDDPSITATGLVLGSPAYMAPEQAVGEGSGPPTDIWGLGATLYYAVEGEAPFGRGEALPTMHAVLHDPPRPARRSSRLEPVLRRLLTKDPARRPAPADVLPDLRRVAGPAPAITRTRRTGTAVLAALRSTPSALAGRRRWALPAAAAALIVLGVIVAVIGGGSDTPAKAGPVPATPTTVRPVSEAPAVERPAARRAGAAQATTTTAATEPTVTTQPSVTTPAQGTRPAPPTSSPSAPPSTIDETPPTTAGSAPTTAGEAGDAATP